MADEIQRWAKQTLFGPGGPPEGVHLDERDGYLISYPSLLRAGEAAIAAAKAQIVGWLRFQEREWRDTSANLGSSVAGNVAAHYAQALHNAIESIESDAPERWAAEREGERG